MQLKEYSDMDASHQMAYRMGLNALQREQKCEYEQYGNCDYEGVIPINFDTGWWCMKHGREVMKTFLEVGCY